MHRHDGATHPQQQLVWNRTEIEPSDGRNIYGDILLLEGVGDCELDREHPILALFDTQSTSSWISSSCFERLKSSASRELGYTKRKGRRKEKDAFRINIRYTCKKFGLEHETGTFNIEPNAKFNISIGCAVRTTPSVTKHYYPSNLTRRKSKRSEQYLSSAAAETFRRAIEEGILPQLKRMPHVLEDAKNFVSVAELDIELSYISCLYSSTQQVLNSDQDDSQSSYILSSAWPPLRELEIRSIPDSETDTYEQTVAESANTSLSEEPSYTTHSLAQRVRHDRSSTPRRPFSIEGWLDQPVYDEPVCMIEDLIPEPEIEYTSNPFPFTRCVEMTPEREAALAAARAKAEEATRDYWIWDDDRQNYKHYDEGCEEPVWYSPP